MSEENEHILPPDDADYLRAKAVGDRLDRNEVPEGALTEGWSAAIPPLRESVHAASPLPAQQDRMWTEIAARTRPSPQESVQRAWPKLRLLQFAPQQRAWYAAAAVFVVLLGISWLVVLTNTAQVIAQAGDTVETVVLADGSEVTLRPHAELVMIRQSSDQQVVQLSGEAYFDVVHNPSRSFVVEAADGQVEVLGTTFSVRTWGGQTEVFLASGRVRFSHRTTGAAVELSPGQRSQTTAAQEVTAPSAAVPEESLDWMVGSLVFDRRSLEDVISELSYHFDVTIEVPPTSATETISGQLTLSSLPQSLSDLGYILGGRFDEVDTQRFVFTPSP